mmetsp:Transcript_11763/g.14262  ORF Transcript_11763/g.14262 Transcript_11763/m.14262 type:complete len:112 (+) Transcript_11763:315-650(+)
MITPPVTTTEDCQSAAMQDPTAPPTTGPACMMLPATFGVFDSRKCRFQLTYCNKELAAPTAIDQPLTTESVSIIEGSLSRDSPSNVNINNDNGKYSSSSTCPSFGVSTCQL